MAPVVITREDILPALREVLNEVGEDHVYTPPPYARDCLYVHPASGGAHPSASEEMVPGCIVGHVLHKLGVPLDRMTRSSGVRRERTSPGVGTLAYTLRRADVADVRPDAETLLALMQALSDTARPWGEIFREVSAFPPQAE